MKRSLTTTSPFHLRLALTEQVQLGLGKRGTQDQVMQKVNGLQISTGLTPEHLCAQFINRIGT